MARKLSYDFLLVTFKAVSYSDTPPPKPRGTQEWDKCLHAHVGCWDMVQVRMLHQNAHSSVHSHSVDNGLRRLLLDGGGGG